MRSALKCLLTVASVAAIGAGVAAFGEEEADALIFARGPIEPDQQRRFVDALRHYDMSPPRAYTYNGQDVYMSRGTSRRSPRGLLGDMQRTFEREGVNRYVHRRVQEGSTPTNARTLRRDFRAAEDMLTGGLVPTTIGERRIAMTGVDNRYGADRLKELTRALVEHEQLPGPELVDRFRYVEAFRGKQSDRTQILAYWSGGEFDMEAFAGSSDSNSGSRASSASPIPVCPHCRRLTHLARQGGGGRTLLFETSASPSRIERFYQRTMRAKGWRASATLESVDRLKTRYGIGPTRRRRRRYAAFQRGKRFVTVLAYPTEAGNTHVKVVVARRS